MNNIFKVNNSSNNDYIKKVYERDYQMINSVIFNSLLNNYIININYNKLYRFATEDISSYIYKLGIMNDLLSVCGSADQIINGILLGAKNIDVFDINYFAKHGLTLRLGALKALTKEEFIHFYYSRFDNDLFEKILYYLNDKDNNFWENIYNCYGKVLINNLFYENRLNAEQLVEINPYLQDNNYEKVKELIKDVNINFIEADLYRLKSFIKTKKYDTINLSNIYEYLNYDRNTSIESARQYKDFIDYLIDNHLKNDGSIMIAYMYKWNKEVKNYFDNQYQKNNKLLSRYDINKDKNLLKKGLTYQNLSYSMLYNSLKIEYEEVLTNTIIYGQNIEKKHDVTLIYRKDSYGNSKNNSG